MADKKIFNKVAIVGVGLIGGSIGMGLKRKKIAKQVIGISRHKTTISRAKKIKAIDIGGQDLRLIQGADLIILAAPVDIIIRQIPQVFKIAKKGCLIFDVGSSKQEIMKAAQSFKKINFVGTHPLAGAEKKGISNARESMFKNSLCILTATKNTSLQALNQVKSLWNSLGARTTQLSAKEHDRIISCISHLPHALAFSLINAVPNNYLKFAASGLKDTTRIAGSDADIWQAIFLSNRDELLRSIGMFEKNLNKIKSAIKQKDKKALVRILKQAKIKRDILS